MTALKQGSARYQSIRNADGRGPGGGRSEIAHDLAWIAGKRAIMGAIFGSRFSASHRHQQALMFVAYQGYSFRRNKGDNDVEEILFHSCHYGYDRHYFVLHCLGGHIQFQSD
jgi:hypothetical protein